MRIPFCFIIWLTSNVVLSANLNHHAILEKKSEDNVDRFNNHLAMIKQLLSVQGDEEKLDELKSSLMDKINTPEDENTNQGENVPNTLKESILSQLHKSETTDILPESTGESTQPAQPSESEQPAPPERPEQQEKPSQSESPDLQPQQSQQPQEEQPSQPEQPTPLAQEPPVLSETQAVSPSADVNSLNPAQGVNVDFKVSNEVKNGAPPSPSPSSETTSDVLAASSETLNSTPSSVEGAAEVKSDTPNQTPPADVVTEQNNQPSTEKILTTTTVTESASFESPAVLRVTETVTYYPTPDATSETKGESILLQEPPGIGAPMDPPGDSPTIDQPPVTHTLPSNMPTTSSAFVESTSAPSSNSAITNEKDNSDRLLWEQIKRLEKIIQQLTEKSSLPVENDKSESRKSVATETQAKQDIPSLPPSEKPQKSVIFNQKPKLVSQIDELVSKYDDQANKQKGWKSLLEDEISNSPKENLPDNKDKDEKSDKSNPSGDSKENSKEKDEKSSSPKESSPKANAKEKTSTPSRVQGKIGKDILNSKTPSYKVSLPPQFRYHNRNSDVSNDNEVLYGKPKKAWFLDSSPDSKSGGQEVPSESKTVNGDDISRSTDISDHQDDKVSGDGILAGEIIGDEVTEKEVTGDGVTRDKVTQDEITGDKVNEIDQGKEDMILLDLDQRPDEDTLDYLRRIYPEIKKILEFEPPSTVEEPLNEPSDPRVVSPPNTSNPTNSSNTSIAPDNTSKSSEVSSVPKTTQIITEEDGDYIYDYIYEAPNDGSDKEKKAPKHKAPKHRDPMSIKHIPPEVLENSAFSTFKSKEELRSSYLKAQEPSNKPLVHPNKHNAHKSDEDSVLMKNPFDVQDSKSKHSTSGHKFSPLSKLHGPHRRNHTGLRFDMFGLKLFENDANRQSSGFASYMAATVMIALSIIWL